MSSSSEGGPAGISVAGASSPFLSGAAQQSILEGLAGQVTAAEQSARSMQGAAGRVGSGIRRAAAAANKLAQAQMARDASRSVQGMSQGGGAVQASGSLAAQGMRERMAGAAATAAQATQAELAAMSEYNKLREDAAALRSAKAVETGKLRAGEQKAGMAFGDEMLLAQNQYNAGQITEEEMAAQMAGKAKFLDPKEPNQRLAIKNAFNTLWMTATEAPGAAPSDAVLEALINAGMPINQMFASWTGNSDKRNKDKFWQMAMATYNANLPDGAPPLNVGPSPGEAWGDEHYNAIAAAFAQPQAVE
jgi:hypothetical protein